MLRPYLCGWLSNKFSVDRYIAIQFGFKVTGEQIEQFEVQRGEYQEVHMDMWIEFLLSF